MMTSLAPLREAVALIQRYVNHVALTELQLIDACSDVIRGLVQHDDWLPSAMAVCHPTQYQQHLLYLDADNRFSLISTVWGPGQATPIHDHTVWGIIGMLRGSEVAQQYLLGNGPPMPLGAEMRRVPGDIEVVSPTLGDIHSVRNAYEDRPSISIHLYGGNIAQIRRHTFDPTTGEAKPFISCYTNILGPL